MASATHREIIYNQWFRESIKRNISVRGLLDITLAFSHPTDQFAYSNNIHCSLKYEDEGSTVIKTKCNKAVCPVFGNHITNYGYLYHWKVKMVKNLCKQHKINVNVGVIQASNIMKSLRTDCEWYMRSFGYSYWSNDGCFYNKQTSMLGQFYGEQYDASDIIDIFLDFRKGRKELWFVKNNKPGSIIEISNKQSYQFSLALSMSGGKKTVELVSFDIIS